MRLVLLPSRLAVCRLDPLAPYPDWAQAGELLALVRTQEELSVVCAQEFVPPGVQAEGGWRAMKVSGPLAFSMLGVLSSLVGPLAQAGVSVFALSTFDTDYLLVKEEMLEPAKTALVQAGHVFMEEDETPA